MPVRLAIFLVTDTNIYPSMTSEYVNEFVLWSLQNAQGIDHEQRAYMPVLHLECDLLMLYMCSLV
jgi:hypothetical protein